MGESVFECALSYLQAGLAVLPVRRGGSKAPAIESWKWIESELPTADHLSEWYDVRTPPGIATVGGKVSGNLEIIDFDHDAEAVFPEWRGLLEEVFPGLFARLCVVRTPRPGYHVRYRFAGVVPGNQKLARWPNPADPPHPFLVVETRGEGG